MEEIFLHVANVILPILICALIGFSLAKLDIPFDNRMVGALVANVGYPTLILSHLEDRHVALAAFAEMLLAALALVVCFGLLAFVFLRLLGLPVRAFLTPLMLNNVGNIGLPVALLAFGANGVAYAIAFVVVVLAGVFTLGMWIPMGEVRPGDVLRKPVIYAVVVAILLMATETRLPGPIDQAFTILGGLAIPLMLLTLGHSLATLALGGLWRGVYLALFHLGMAAAVAFGLVSLFGFTGTERGVFILMALMPPSVASYLFVELYQKERAPDVASFILVSTLATILVLPLALTLWI